MDIWKFTRKLGHAPSSARLLLEKAIEGKTPEQKRELGAALDLQEPVSWITRWERPANEKRNYPSYPDQAQSQSMLAMLCESGDMDVLEGALRGSNFARGQSYLQTKESNESFCQTLISQAFRLGKPELLALLEKTQKGEKRQEEDIVHGAGREECLHALALGSLFASEKKTEECLDWLLGKIRVGVLSAGDPKHKELREIADHVHRARKRQLMDVASREGAGQLVHLLMARGAVPSKNNMLEMFSAGGFGSALEMRDCARANPKEYLAAQKRAKEESRYRSEEEPNTRGALMEMAQSLEGLFSEMDGKPKSELWQLERLRSKENELRAFALDALEDGWDLPDSKKGQALEGKKKLMAVLLPEGRRFGTGHANFEKELMALAPKAQGDELASLLRIGGARNEELFKMRAQGIGSSWGKAQKEAWAGKLAQALARSFQKGEWSKRDEPKKLKPDEMRSALEKASQCAEEFPGLWANPAAGAIQCAEIWGMAKHEAEEFLVSRVIGQKKAAGPSRRV